MTIDVTVEDLLGLTVLIAGGFLLAVAFYESLSTRDVLVARMQALARRISRRWWVSGIAYVLTVAIGIPLLIVLWTVVLDLALFVLVPPDGLDSIAFTAVAIVGAARLLAYARQKTAHELAKAIPMAFLFLLLTRASPDLDEKLALIEERDVEGLTDEMIAYLIALEVALRILTSGSQAVLAWSRRRHGIDSELGVWSTIAVAAGLRHVHDGSIDRDAGGTR